MRTESAEQAILLFLRREIAAGAEKSSGKLWLSPCSTERVHPEVVECDPYCDWHLKKGIGVRQTILNPQCAVGPSHFGPGRELHPGHALQLRG